MPHPLRMLAAVTVAIATLVPAPASAGEYPPSPFLGRTLYVDPASVSAEQAALLRSTNPDAADALYEVARQSQADWYGDWNPTDTLRGTVAARNRAIRAVHAYPVLVAYNIPQRDCGSHSGGGASSPAAYREWVDELVAGIGRTPVAVIVEPDALAQLDCLSSNDRRTRVELLRYAVTALAAKSNIAVYLDAGHSGWVDADEMAERLSRAGIAHARGFSLNVSNFSATDDEIAYGREISPRIGWKRFVVDTSRNGNGASDDGEWCNPDGRALGEKPTADTGDRLVDAFLWVKHPGESDGTCNGGPAAGQFWWEYALELARRAW